MVAAGCLLGHYFSGCLGTIPLGDGKGAQSRKDCVPPEGVQGGPCTKAFQAFDCNNESAPVEQYSLLDPEPCGNMQKSHVIERELQGEIVQI
jgi:hypothetical protein